MSNTVEINKVVSLAYTLRLDNGDVVDTAGATDPLEYLHGAGNIIPGLERALTGLKVGSKTSVSIAPADAYGEYDAEAVEVMDVSELPKGMPLQPGLEVDFEDESGEMNTGVIVDVKGSRVTFDFNHPLAGKTLHFAVEIIDVRDATGEELEHGHPHGLFDFEGDDEDEFYEYDDDDEEDFDDDDEYDEDEDEDDLRRN